MILADKCPRCGAALDREQVEELLKGGGHSAVVHVQADVCHHCGERLYSAETVRLFEQIRSKLENRQFDEFVRTGHSFEVPA